MKAMNGTGRILFQFDPWRGGFLLQLGPITRKLVRPLFDSLITAFLREDGRIEAVESFWDHGGLPLRGIHGASTYPMGTHSVGGDELRVGSFLLRQNPDKLAIWFSTGGELPRKHWFVRQDVGLAVVAYFSSRKAKAGWPVPVIGGRSEIEMLAGLELELARTVAEYPIRSITLLLLRQRTSSECVQLVAQHALAPDAAPLRCAAQVKRRIKG